MELAGDVALRAQSAGLRDERFANGGACAATTGASARWTRPRSGRWTWRST